MGLLPVVTDNGESGGSAAHPLSLVGGWLKDVLRSITDIIRTLSPYWRAVSLMVFMFLIMFLVLIDKRPNEAWLGLVAAAVISVTGIMNQPAANDPSLADGQDRRNDLILPKKPVRPRTKP